MYHILIVTYKSGVGITEIQQSQPMTLKSVYANVDKITFDWRETDRSKIEAEFDEAIAVSTLGVKMTLEGHRTISVCTEAELDALIARLKVQPKD